MSIESVLSASRDGLNYERMRLDAASRNISSANQPIANGINATRLTVSEQASGFQSRIALTNADIGTRLVSDPGNPMADADGYVRYPDIDMVSEMTTLITASRGYEANVRSFNMIRGMVLKALELGAK